MPPRRVNVRVLSFAFDDENLEKILSRGIQERQIDQVLSNRHVIIRNRRSRRGLHLIIGLDNGGACFAIPIEPTRDLNVWRPVTAWRCKEHEADTLRRKQSERRRRRA